MQKTIAAFAAVLASGALTASIASAAETDRMSAGELRLAQVLPDTSPRPVRARPRIEVRPGRLL